MKILLVYAFLTSCSAIFPKYPEGSCVIDTKVQRIHKITGPEDKLKGSGIPTKILKVGQAVPGSFSVGMASSIRIDDPAIQKTDCPTK